MSRETQQPYVISPRRSDRRKLVTVPGGVRQGRYGDGRRSLVSGDSLTTTNSPRISGIKSVSLVPSQTDLRPGPQRDSPYQH